METEVVPVDVKQLTQPFKNALQVITERGVELRAMKPGPAKASLAFEYAQDIKRYLEELEASELSENVRRADQTHKYLLKVKKQFRLPAEINLKLCSDIRADWEVERRRRREAERQKKEQEAARQAAEERKAEIEHLREIGKAQEAEDRAAQPIEPRAVLVNEDAGKPTGEMFVEVWVPKRDESGAICFSDEAAYRKWNAERPEFYYLMEHRYGKLKKLLTDNRGLLQPPGLLVEHKFEPRTRSADDEE
jgi:hypothetical protein